MFKITLKQKRESGEIYQATEGNAVTLDIAMRIVALWARTYKDRGEAYHITVTCEQSGKQVHVEHSHYWFVKAGKPTTDTFYKLGAI